MKPLRLALLGGLLIATACTGSPSATTGPTTSGPAPIVTQVPTAGPAKATPQLLPGMPPPLSPTDVWAADRPGRFAASVRRIPVRIYVPNSGSNTVTEIDPRTYRVIRTFPTGRQPQHVVPSWDLRSCG